MKRNHLLVVLGFAGALAGVYLAVRSPESIRALKQYASKPLDQGVRYALGFFGGKQRVPGDSVNVMGPARPESWEMVPLFKDYLIRHAGSGAAGREQIDKMRSLDAKLPPEDVDAIGKLIRNGQVTGDELVGLVRLYGDQYLFHRKNQILEDIKAVLQTTTDRNVGNAAILSFSRLGPVEDIRSLLRSSREREFISEDDYFGEIAHNLFRASPNVQTPWIEELVSGQNMYSRGILADFIAREVRSDYLSVEAARQLQSYFQASETKFPENPVEYGLFAAIDYENWLASSAKLISVAEGGSPESFIRRTLLDKDLDPRKALSWFLADERLHAFINATSQEDRQVLADRLMFFSNRGGNDFVYDSVQSIYPKLTSSNGNKKP